MTFTCLSAANVYYGPFHELQEGPTPALQITTRSVIATYYGKYGKLLEVLEDQLILDNDEIVGDVGDVKKVKDAKDIGKVKNRRDGGDTRDAGKARNAKDVGDPRDAKDKEVGRGNDKAVNGGDQENNDDKIGYGGDQEAGKPEDIEVGNNSVDNGEN